VSKKKNTWRSRTDRRCNCTCDTSGTSAWPQSKTASKMNHSCSWNLSKSNLPIFVNKSQSKITLWSIWQPWLWVNSSGLISWILSSLNELFVTSLMVLTFVSSWSVSTKYINSSWASSCLPTRNRFEILHRAFTNFWGFTQSFLPKRLSLDVPLRFAGSFR
jgi:hypothetical protein